jgi:16S rRNA (guanine966-N2)-methyltransferase
MHDIRGARCLDAFAGSGALGLEAFSRGAGRVTFIEQSPEVQAYLKKVITQFKDNKLNLIKADTLSYLQSNAEQYDIIFLDPPFSKNYLPQCLENLAASTLLAPGGLVYIEAPQVIEINDTTWEQIKAKQAGNVVYGLLKKRI